MVFAAPLVLLGLIPWGAVAAYLLWGRGRRVAVPFLPLWHGAEAAPRAMTAALRRPPVALLALMLAMLLGVLAAARPALRWGGPAGGDLRIVVDRGLTMSALATGTHEPRFLAAAEGLAGRVGAGRVEVVDAVTGEAWRGAGRDWLARVRQMRRTAVASTPASVRAAVAERQGDGRTFVITDQGVAFDDPSVTVVGPSGAWRDVGIARVGVRERPVPQVMVELASAGFDGRVEVRVTSGAASASESVVVAAGERAAAFVDLPQLGETVEARLVDAGDDLDADDVAYVAREGAAPARLEARTPLPAALARMVAVYGKGRPAGEGSAVVAVAALPGEVGASEVAAVLEMPAADGVSRSVGAEDFSVVAHPVTAAVDWVGVARRAVAAGGTAPDGFTALVGVRGRAVVAARESPARQVWVGLDDAAFAADADYVVFWTNVFQWLGEGVGGGGAASFVSHPVTLAPVAWERVGAAPAGVDAAAWPGVFRRPGGEAYAASVGPVVAPASSAMDVASITDGPAVRSVVGLGAWLQAGAIACAAVAAMTWGRTGTRRSQLAHTA